MLQGRQAIETGLVHGETGRRVNATGTRGEVQVGETEVVEGTLQSPAVLTVAWTCAVRVEAVQLYLTIGSRAVDMVGFPEVVAQRASISRPPHVDLS